MCGIVDTLAHGMPHPSSSLACDAWSIAAMTRLGWQCSPSSSLAIISLLGAVLMSISHAVCRSQSRWSRARVRGLYGTAEQGPPCCVLT